MTHIMKNFTRRSLLAITLFSLLFSLSFLPSCSKDSNADAGALLATVPSDAGAVAAVNLHSLLEKAGAKFDGSKFTPSPSLTDAAKAAGGKSPLLSLFLSGESGIDPSCAILFKEGDAVYLVALLDDPDKLRKAAPTHLGGQFATSEGFDILGNIAIKGNMIWQRLDRSDIRPEETARFSSLSDRQNILSVKNADRLSELSSDLECWANIAALLNASGMDFSSRGMATMALQTLLEDPADFYLTGNCDKGLLNVEATVLDSKGNNAKLLIPTAEVDPAAISLISAKRADAISAVGVSQKLIKSLRKEVESNGVSMLGLIMQSLGALDGTSAFAVSAGGDNIAGVVSTTGEDTLPLTNLLDQMGLTVTVDGKLLRVRKGETNGHLDIAAEAPLFKKAMFGVVSAVNFQDNPDLSKAAVMFIPRDGGLTLNVSVYATDKNANIITTLLKSAK